MIIVGGFDTETTGFNEPEHRIIEACVLRYELDPADVTNWRELDEYTIRIDPERTIPAEASRVHGIYAPDLVGKPKWKAAAKPLRDRLNSCDIVVAHNGLDFDFPFFIRELDRVGVDLPDFEPFDTMTEGRWATAWGEVPSLMKLCFACGVEYVPAEAHAAKYDVQKMMGCFFYGLKHGYFKLPVP